MVAMSWVASGYASSQPGTGTELKTAITAQEERAQECDGSKYAQACPPGALMIFEQTMFGFCSPVGCFDSPWERGVRVSVDMFDYAVSIYYVVHRRR